MGRIDHICWVCHSSASLRCKRCGVPYCGAICQSRDWQLNHRHACKKLCASVEEVHVIPKKVLDTIKDAAHVCQQHEQETAGRIGVDIDSNESLSRVESYIRRGIGYAQTAVNEIKPLDWLTYLQELEKSLPETPDAKDVANNNNTLLLDPYEVADTVADFARQGAIGGFSALKLLSEQLVQVLDYFVAITARFASSRWIQWGIQAFRLVKQLMSQTMTVAGTLITETFLALVRRMADLLETIVEPFITIVADAYRIAAESMETAFKFILEKAKDTPGALQQTAASLEKRVKTLLVYSLSFLQYGPQLTLLYQKEALNQVYTHYGSRLMQNLRRAADNVTSNSALFARIREYVTTQPWVFKLMDAGRIALPMLAFVALAMALPDMMLKFTAFYLFKRSAQKFFETVVQYLIRLGMDYAVETSRFLMPAPDPTTTTATATGDSPAIDIGSALTEIGISRDMDRIFEHILAWRRDVQQDEEAVARMEAVRADYVQSHAIMTPSSLPKRKRDLRTLAEKLGQALGPQLWRTSEHFVNIYEAMRADDTSASDAFTTTQAVDAALDDPQVQALVVELFDATPRSMFVRIMEAYEAYKQEILRGYIDWTVALMALEPHEKLQTTTAANIGTNGGGSSTGGGKLTLPDSDYIPQGYLTSAVIYDRILRARERNLDNMTEVGEALKGIDEIMRDADPNDWNAIGLADLPLGERFAVLTEIRSDLLMHFNMIESGEYAAFVEAQEQQLFEARWTKRRNWFTGLVIAGVLVASVYWLIYPPDFAAWTSYYNSVSTYTAITDADAASQKSIFMWLGENSRGSKMVSFLGQDVELQDFITNDKQGFQQGVKTALSGMSKAAENFLIDLNDPSSALTETLQDPRTRQTYIAQIVGGDGVLGRITGAVDALGAGFFYGSTGYSKQLNDLRFDPDAKPEDIINLLRNSVKDLISLFGRMNTDDKVTAFVAHFFSSVTKQKEWSLTTVIMNAWNSQVIGADMFDAFNEVIRKMADRIQGAWGAYSYAGPAVIGGFLAGYVILSMILYWKRRDGKLKKIIADTFNVFLVGSGIIVGTGTFAQAGFTGKLVLTGLATGIGLKFFFGLARKAAIMSGVPVISQVAYALPESTASGVIGSIESMAKATNENPNFGKLEWNTLLDKLYESKKRREEEKLLLEANGPTVSEID